MPARKWGSESKKLSVLKATAGTEKRSDNEAGQYLKSLAGWMFPAKEEKQAWNCFDRRRDFHAVGCTPQLASQPELGYYPSSGLGMILLILIILLQLGQFYVTAARRA